VGQPLRADEINACVHRVALVRGAPGDVTPAAASTEVQRRRRDADAFRRSVLAAMTSHPGATRPVNTAATRAALAEGVELIVEPRLPEDVAGRRRAAAHALVRVGRVEQRFVYAPIIVKNTEVIEPATTRRLLEGSLERLSPHEAAYTDGVGLRPTPTVTRHGLALVHVTHVLAALGHDDPARRGAVVDRRRRVWWVDLAAREHRRFNLDAYERLYTARLEVLAAHDAWREHDGPFPTSPYWHRECLDCPFAGSCAEELAARDDVSLVRFTSLDQQLLLREHGVRTRAALAELDPARARSARRRPVTDPTSAAPEDVLGRHIDKLDELIYRARAQRAGTALRIVDADAVHCPRADVEVDVDMESYGDTTYLWGALVTRPTHEDVAWDDADDGYHAYAQWGELTRESEARLFADFWRWFDDLRGRVLAAGLSFRAYCFWAQAEDGAMDRAVASAWTDGPRAEDLAAFRAVSPSQWVDLHALVREQIQTEGPRGLKTLAGAAGFTWRDPTPGGEASMLWYEVARGEGEDAEAARRRLLAYNEDDCRATRVLREWLNGPARHLAHREDA
jgi:predicted RecB family nuclease